MSDDKHNGPVTEDENFVNVDPDFANWSNEVDRPVPLPEVEDYNVPEGFRDNKDDKDDEKADEKKEEEKSTTTPAPASTPKPAVAPATK